MAEFTTMQELPDQVFCLWEGQSYPVWFALVGGKVVKATWLSKGAAQAGMQTEQRRLARKLVLDDLDPNKTAGGDVAIPSQPKGRAPKRRTDKFVAGKGELTVDK